jgi:hypothetical protein
MEMAPGIHRIGDKSIINAYLVEEAGQVTVVDAGVSGLYGDLPRELASRAEQSPTFARWSSRTGTATTSALPSASATIGRSPSRSTRPTRPWLEARYRTPRRAMAPSRSLR